MPFDHDDFQKSVDRKQVDRTRTLMPLIRVLENAAPVMNELMTADGNWNRYLAILQGFVEGIKIAKAAAEQRLADSNLWEHHHLVKLKSDVLQSAAMLDILTTVMELPKAILEGGEAAHDIVTNFEAKHASTAEKTLP